MTKSTHMWNPVRHDHRLMRTKPVGKNDMLVFDDATARDASLTNPVRGLVCYLLSTNAVQVYDDAAFWRTIGGRVCSDLEADLWLTASHGINVAAGGAVEDWVDQSGNAHVLTQATGGYQPLFAPSGVERPYVSFDGTDDTLEIAKADFANSLTALSVIVRANYDASTDGYAIARFESAADDRSWAIAVFDTEWRAYVTNDGTFSGDAAAKIYEEETDIRGGISTLAFTFDAGTLKIFRDGVEITPILTKDNTCTSLYDSTAAISLASIAGASWSNMDIEQVAIFNKALTTDQINAVHKEWANYMLWQGL